MNSPRPPRWLRISEVLARRVAEGVYTPGEQLPTEHALAESFDVNRHTVRQALAHLVARGLLRVAQGRGTFVEEFSIGYALGKRTRFSENLSRLGLEGRHVLVEEQRLPAPPDVARHLGVRKDTQLVRLRTRGEARAGRESSARTLSVSDHWYVAKRVPGLGEAVVRTGSISAGLRECGIMDFSRTSTAITARLPEAGVAAILRQAATRPVLWVESVNVDPSGRAIEFARTQFAGDAVQLTVAHDAL